VTDVPAQLGAVYDRGYRPYEGVRGGRPEARAALFRMTLRRALGLRRSWRQKVMPFALLAIATVPAIVNVGIGYVTRDTPAEGFEFITYREYVGVSTTLLLFVALTAGDILCPDRAHRVLPVIFARPLTGADYAMAKLAALSSILFTFGFLPQVVLFVGQALVSNDFFNYVRDNAEVMWQVPIAVAIQAVFMSAVGLALASLTSRRMVAGASFIGLLLVTGSIAAAFTEGGEGGDERPSAGAVVAIVDLPLHVRDLVFLGHVDPEGPLTGVGGGGAMAVAGYALVLATAVALLLHRYRWEDVP
jgi:ABC-2 type transport system permease protein